DALPIFTSQPFLLHHRIDEAWNLKNSVLFIVGNVIVNSFCNVNQSIKTNNVNGSKSCGFWSPNYRTGQFINLFDCKPHFLYLMKKTLDAEDSYSISYKGRCIFCDYGGFSEEFFSITI